jgi:hypothetical protein
MVELQYFDNVHNPQPTVTVMDQGDYLVSPSGVYNAVLNSNGSFAVSYGSRPNTQPTLWSVSGVHGSDYVAPWTIQNVPQWSQSEYYIFAHWNGSGGTPNGTNVPTDGYIVAQDNSATAPDFMQLNDNGTVSIYQGNNGVKTNPNENAVATRGTSNNVTGITLNTITYDTADTVYNAVDKVVGLDATYTNTTATPQVYPNSVSLAYTDSETFNWSTSATISATISSSTKIGIPGIGDQTETISLTGSASISKGQSTTQTVTATFSQGGQTSVPGESEYAVHMTGYEQVATVPYTWTGIAYHADGYSAPITGSGNVLSDTTGVFNVETDCVYTPGGCPGGLGAPVPEPPTFVTVPLAFAALLALAAVRRRRRRGTSRDNGFGSLRLA